PRVLVLGPNTVANDPEATLFLIALQAEGAGGDKPSDVEAGSYFWKAAKLARQQKYAEALPLLEKARAAHDDRRFARLRKSQNPASDPTEEIFLRACDELRMFWQLQERLRSGGYLDVAKQADPIKSLDTLLAEAKQPKTDPAVQVVIDRLKKDKDVSAADPEVKDVGKGLDLLLEVKKKSQEQLASIQSLLKDAKYVTA